MLWKQKKELLLLVDGVFKGLASRKFYGPSGGDLDGFSGTGVTAGTRCTLAGTESTKSNQLYCVSLGDRFDNGCDRGIQHFID